MQDGPDHCDDPVSGKGDVEMRKTIAWVLMGTACAVLSNGGSGPAAAQTTVILRENPTDCEVAAALGINKSGCPPLAQVPRPVPKAPSRNLSIGNAGTMPAQPPTLPEPPTVKPTAAAAPAPVVPEQPQPLYTASFRVMFEFGSARLTGNAPKILDLIGAAMTAPEAKTVHFRIVGHTDAVGSAARNQKLSESRAHAVMVYLIQHFSIDPARLTASGRGALDLLNPSNPSGAENRRVEIGNLGG